MSYNIKKQIEHGKTFFRPSWTQSIFRKMFGVTDFFQTWERELNLLSAKKIQIEVAKLCTQRSSFQQWLLGLKDLNMRLTGLCSSLEQQLISETNRMQQKEVHKLSQRDFLCIEQHLDSRLNFLKSQTIVKPEKDNTYRYMKEAYDCATKRYKELDSWLNFAGPSPSRCHNLVHFDNEATVWNEKIKNLKENAPTVTINSAGKPCYSPDSKIAFTYVGLTQAEICGTAQHRLRREQEIINRRESERRAQERHYYEWTLPMQRFRENSNMRFDWTTPSQRYREDIERRLSWAQSFKPR